MGLKGSCLCGAVLYEVDQLDTPIGHYHCNWTNVGLYHFIKRPDTVGEFVRPGRAPIREPRQPSSIPGVRGSARPLAPRTEGQRRIRQRYQSYRRNETGVQRKALRLSHVCQGCRTTSLLVDDLPADHADGTVEIFIGMPQAVRVEHLHAVIELGILPDQMVDLGLAYNRTAHGVQGGPYL